MFENLKQKLSSLNFLDGISPIYFFSKATGMAPFSFGKIGNTTKFSRNAISSLYTVVLYVIYLVSLYIFCSQTAASDNFMKFPYVAKIGYWIHITSGFIMSFVCLFLSFFKVDKVTEFLNGVHDIDRKLNEINMHFRIEYKRSFLFQIKTIAIVFLALILASTYDYFVFYDLYGELKIIVILTYLLPYIIAYNSSPGQFVAGIYLIYERFQFINNLLNNIAGANQDTALTMRKINRLFPEQKNQSSVINRKQFDESLMEEPIPGTLIKEITPVAVQEKSSNMFDLIKSVVQWKSFEAVGERNIYNLHLQMHEIFSLHDNLCLMAEKINDIYCVEIVISITCGFVITLFAFFFEIKVIFWTGLTAHLLMFASSYIIWGMVISLIIYQVLYICSNTREECYESALVIHKILVNKPSFMTTDEIYYTKMKSFTLEILHRKKIFNFNGLGLFNLDYTFIFSAVSAATSYLIVLLQLDLTDEFEKFSKIIQG